MNTYVISENCRIVSAVTSLAQVAKETGIELPALIAQFKTKEESRYAMFVDDKLIVVTLITIQKIKGRGGRRDK